MTPWRSRWLCRQDWNSEVVAGETHYRYDAICYYLTRRACCLVIERLYEQAHEYANLANRAGPIATDLLRASVDRGMQTKDLHKLGRAKSSKKKKTR